MTRLRTQTVRVEAGGGEPADDPFATPQGTLHQQAAAVADVARQVRKICNHGEDAERELQRRRNTSGQ